MRKKILLMTFLVAIIGFCGTGLTAQNNNVAKVGNTEYATIDEAIANWTNGTTLTLLANVTLSDVIKLSSTEYHILDLGNCTMTAASKKDAIQIVNNGRSSASYALDIKADDTNTGGITATDKAVVRTAGKSGVKDRPIIRFYNGVFDGSYIVYHSGSNGTNCPQFQFYGGVFNGTIYTNRTLNQFYGGTFNGSLMMSVDSSAYTLIAGGTFKQLSNLYMSALNSGKFTIGSAKGVYDKEVYIDDNGNYVIAATEPAQGIEADVAKTPGTNDYLAYSKVATEGQLGYTDVYTALEKNTSATVTVYVEELDLEDSNFKGTIVVPEGEKITIVTAAGVTPTWTVSANDDAVTYTDADGKELVKDENGSFVVPPVAKIGETSYETLQAAVDAVQNSQTITLLADVAEDVTIPAGVTFNGNGKAVGNITAAGAITFNGHTKATSFSVENTNTTINIVEGACLEITGTGRMVIGHGCTFDITGTIADAKTANVADVTPSLVMPGASFTGAGVTFNVTNAYIKTTASYCSSSKSASSTFDFNIENSIWEQFGKLAFESQSVNATVNFDLVNSVLTTTSHLVFGVSRGEVVIDNSNVNVGTSRQIENQSRMTIKNGSVVNGAVATSSNAKNPGTIIVEDATYAVTGEFSGSDLGTGTLIIKKGATVSAGSITKANIQIDATGMTIDDEINLTANLANHAGTLEVVNNDNLTAKIVDGKIVLAERPAAKIGDVEYASLQEAFAAATEGQTITMLVDATPALTSQRAITKAAVIDLGGKTMTLTEDDLYFGTTTFKNGTIIVDPSVKPSTAVFWMFANQTLTFDNVKIVATGVTGTYLIGLDGNNSDLNLLNGSEILVENTTALDLDIICVNASTGNDIKVENSTVNVTNLDGRVFFRGNYTVKDSEVNLKGITKAGFRIEAGQTLSIEGTSNVNIIGEPRDGGIHLTDLTATYTKEETATVNATVNEPKVAQVGENTYRTLAEAAAAAQAGNEIKLLADATVEGTLALPAGIKLTSNGHTINGSIRMLGDLELNSPLTITGGLWVGKSGETLTATLSGDKLTASYFMFQHGTYTINADIDAVYGYLSFNGKFEVNSTIHTTGANGEVLYINGNVNLNDGAVLDSDNSVFVCNDNAVLTLKPGSKVDSNVKITTSGAKLNIDATGMTAGASANITGTVTNSGNGTIAVVGNDKLEAKIVDGKIVLAAKPVAKIGETPYTTLEAAFKAATSGCTIDILSDVTVDYNWDARYTGGKFTVPVTINGNDKTIKFTASVNDNNYQAPFRFEKEATVNNLTVDMSEVTDVRFRAISSKDNLTVDGCKFIGKDETLNCRAIIFGEGAGANVGNLAIAITNSEFINWKRGITDNENAQDVKTVTITGNTLTDAGVGVSAKETVTFTGNTVAGAYVNIKSYTAGNKLAVTATGNNLEPNTNVAYNVIDAGGVVNAEGFNIVAKGNDFTGYTRGDAIWGEVWGNAKESFVIKVLDANGNVMGTTSLNNVGGIINGNVNVTWSLKLDAASNTDEYWTMEWTTAPTIDNMPAKVELWVDGDRVSGGNVVLNGPDNINKIYAAVTDNTGKILAYHTNVQEAIKAAAAVTSVAKTATAGTVEVLSDVTVDKWVMFAEKMSIGDGSLITLNINGVTIDGNNNTLTVKSIESASNGGYLFYDAQNLTVKDLTINIADGLVGGIGLQSGTISNVTFNGGQYAVLPGKNGVTVSGCTFKDTKSYAVYYEDERPGIVVTDNTFNTADGAYAITMRSNEQFTNNTVEKGRVNLANSAKSTVSGNDFGNERFKVYNGATATISDNKINNLVFSETNVPTESTFTDNILSTEAQAAIDALPVMAGDGTEANPYTIGNLAQLKAFRDEVNAGNNYQGKFVKLTADIDLNNEEWTPIATFNGKFDGNDKTISNLVVNGEGKSNQGFFGQTNNGEIKNLKINNATVKGRLNVGVVAGTPYTSKYTNIKVTGDVVVEGMAYVGGVGGKNAYANWTDITVDVNDGSYVKATSTENGTAYRTYVGGVIGFNGEGGHTFKNISSNIKVIGDVMDIGGIFGILHYGNNAENITFEGAVEAPADAKEVGGIAGVWHNEKGQTVTITNAKSEGTVKIGDVSTTGSIVGGAYNADNKYEANSGSLIIDGNEAWLPRKVTTKADLNAALAVAKEGDIIVMDADIDYGTDQLAIAKAITLDLGGKTLTTRNAWGGMSIKNNPTVKNGTIVHASNTAAIKVWNATAFEDLVIDVQGKGDANKTIGGIVLQSGSTTRVGSIKNVTIKGAALTNGIETYNCGDATENVIGAMENVTIDAQGTGLLISAPCGTATNCDIKGGVTGIELWIKGNYSATLALVDSDVKGGEKPVYVHDEFSTNPDIQNNGTLALTANEATTFTSESGALAAVNIARAENADRTVVDKLIENAIVCVGDVYFDDFAKAWATVKDGQTITLLADVTLAGGYEDATEGLRIEKEITLNGNGYTINCGNFQKGIRIYNPSNVSDFNVNFNNVTVVNNVANGRCIDTRSGNINLKVNSSTLIATNGNSQPLTIGGNDPVHRVTLNETTIDAGASGYAVISFVSTNVDIQGVNNSTISGFAAFYLKGDAKTTNLNLGQGVYTGTNNHAIESGVFGTVVLEGDNNVVNLMGTNATVKAIANNTAPQAAFLVRGANNTIKITKESAKIITEGNAYEAMVKADNAATTKFVDMGIERKLVAENEGYQFYSFEEAVRFAGNEGTIKVVNDFELAEAWTVAAGQNITLDLNGKTISQEKACTASYEMICNKGNLTITDSSDAKDGKLSFKDTSAGDPSFGWGSYTVRNEGNLVVENGTIEHLGEQAFAKHCIMAIYQYSGSTTINGGTISTPNYRSARLWKGDMTINGGTFDGQVWVQAVDNTAKLTVNGGTFEPNGNDASAVFVTNSQYDVQFAVTDGTFNGKVGCSDATKLAGAITGGKFTETAKNGTNAALLATGLAFGEADANGYYAVEDDPATHYIATLDELKAFRDAVNTGANYYAGVNVYLAADIDMTGENWVGIGTATADHGFMGNFDGQDYKIKNLTITDPALDSDGYAYAGFFGVTEGTDKDNQNTIKNLTIENVTISTTGHIAAAAIAYPYYTIIDNVKVCGDIKIQGGDYTAGVLAYTRRCVNASNLSIVGNEGSFVKGNQTVGGVISDIQMNGGLTAVYNNFSAEGLTISGTKQVGGISGIIATQTLVGASVKNVALNCSDARVGIVSGALGGTSTISNVTYENVTGATNLIGATYDGAKAVAAKIGNTYYATLEAALAADGNEAVELLATYEVAAGETKTLDLKGKTVTMVYTQKATKNHTMISNSGNLTIESSVEGGKLSYTYAGENLGTTYSANTVTSNPGSVLTVKSGTIENLTFDSGIIAYAIDGLTNGGAGDVTVNIEGGVITSKRQALRIFANSTTNTGALNISGGDFTGRVIVQNSNSNANKAALNITGGTFNANEYKSDVLYVGGNNSATIDIDATVSGGTFKGEITETHVTGFISGGTFSSDVSAFCAKGFVCNDNGNGTYGVVEKSAVAKIDDVEYKYIQDAIDAANATDVINVVSSTTENITIADNDNITLTFSEGVTLNGYFAPFKGNLTINGGTINNTNSGASAIEINDGELNLNNVNIASARHAVRIDGAVTATINGGEYTLTATSGTRHAVNVSGGAEVTIKAGTFVGPKGTTMDSGSAVCVQAGAKVTIEGGDFSGGKNATLGVTGTMTVTGGTFDQDPSAYLAQGYITKYNETTSRYEVFKGVAKIEDEYFASIQDAIDAAENNDVIKVLNYIYLSDDKELNTLDGKYNTYFKVEGKTVTIDLNGKIIYVEYSNPNMLVGVFSTENNGHLTLMDSSNGTGSVDVVTKGNGVVYSLIANYESGCSITINGGTYKLDKASDSHIYSGCGCTNEGTQGVTVNGGVFYLGNVATGSNGSPWIFNVKGQNNGHVKVFGGTYNYNVFNQHWIFEAQTSKEYAIRYDGDETWTVVPAVAWVNNQKQSGGNWYTYELGYATLAEAIAAAEDCNRPDFAETVTLLQDITLENTITVNAGKDVILDLNGKTISGVCNSGQGHMFMVQNTADLTIKDSSENEEGKITYARGTSNTGWVIDLEGDLILESGTIELTGDSWSIGYVVDVRPNSWGSEYTEATTFTMKGGKLVSSDAAVRVASSSADNHENVSANFIMNGGEIEAAWDGIFVQQSNAAYDILNVRINGGNIKSALSPLRLYGPAATSVLNNVENPITLNITGGTFDYTGSNLEDTRWLVPGVIMIAGGATFDQMLDYTGFEITGGTFEGDVNAYCAEGFAATNNGNGTWTVMPAQEQSLVKGWNWYSTYLNITTDDLKSALGNNATVVKGQTQTDGYLSYDAEGFGWSGTLNLDFAKMYMINTTGACDIRVAAEVLNPNDHKVVLNGGWNWIGYPSNESVSVSVAFSDLTPKEGDVIKTRNSGHAEYAWGMWVGTLKSMKPGEGYMYRNTEVDVNGNPVVKEFKYTVETTSTTSRGTVEANYTAENNHWVPNVSEYPFNMTMTAVVDGLTDGNYEVAAFVNGEVRGSARPIYVEPMDAYVLFLTINGEDVEEMSFRLYDIDNDTEYDLSDRINYSNNAHLGSVNEPYVFSRGTTGIGEASMSEVNIYPNPTTTGTEINLEATCDKVEVFNALGVKVAEYQNVDTIDALETAGIYVIRITNNGNVQNCRLVVK